MAFSPSCRCDDKANTGATLRMKSFGLGGRVWKVAGKLGTSYDSRASGWSALREAGCRGRQPLRERCRRAMLCAAGDGLRRTAAPTREMPPSNARRCGRRAAEGGSPYERDAAEQCSALREAGDHKVCSKDAWKKRVSFSGSKGLAAALQRARGALSRSLSGTGKQEASGGDAREGKGNDAEDPGGIQGLVSDQNSKRKQENYEDQREDKARSSLSPLPLSTKHKAGKQGRAEAYG